MISRLLKTGFSNFSLFSKSESLFHSKLCPNNRLIISPEVQSALSTNRPVVALESAVLTHGLPYPINEQLANDLEYILQSHDVCPATIAVIDGKLHVGLDRDQISRICQSTFLKEQPIKISRHNLAIQLVKSSKRGVGGTTVSGTMIAAGIAGIEVFATGGIGGVHRDFAESHDVSQDLWDLSRIPVMVVSAGIKSILDIKRTLEQLETCGVPVVTLTSNNVEISEFPGFFSSKSGHPSPNTFNDAREVVDSFLLQRELYGGGILVAIPPISDSSNSLKLMDDKYINDAIEKAQFEVQEKSIMGHRVTPYILSRVNELTEGRSLIRNVNVLKNNVETAARLANILYKKRVLACEKSYESECQNLTENSSSLFVAIGEALIDTTVLIEDERFQAQGLQAATYNGRVFHSCGGVGRNLGEVLARLGGKVHFISKIKEKSGTYFESFIDTAIFLKSQAESIGLDWSYVERKVDDDMKNISSPFYISVMHNNLSELTNHRDNNSNLLFGIGSADSEMNYLNTDFVIKSLDKLLKSQPPKLSISMDANCSWKLLQAVNGFVAAKREAKTTSTIHLWYEPTDLFKCLRLFNIILEGEKLEVFCATPNRLELVSILEFLLSNYYHSNKDLHSIIEEFKLILKPDIDCLQASNLRVGQCLLELADRILLPLIPNWLVKMDTDGVYFLSKNPDGKSFVRSFSTLKIARADIRSVSGAGDCLVGAVMFFLEERGWNWEDSIRAGLLAAKYSLEVHCSVPATVSKLSKLSQSQIKQLTKSVTVNIFDHKSNL